MNNYQLLVVFLFTFYIVFFAIVLIVQYRTHRKNMIVIVAPSQARIDAAHKAIVEKYEDPNFTVVREEIPTYSRPEIGQSWV